MKLINNTVSMRAPKEKVWAVLTQDNYTRIWYNEFGPGTYVETDWSIGSKAVFKGNSDNGLIAKIVENTAGELLSIEYTGILQNGKEDYSSPEVQRMLGGRETYRLTEKDGVTQLETSAAMDESMYDMMADAWQKALKKIIALSEN